MKFNIEKSFYDYDENIIYNDEKNFVKISNFYIIYNLLIDIS